MAQVLKNELRNKILAAATSEVLSFGIEKASMRNIACNCNVTVGNIYRYFGSKDELIASIYIPFLSELNKVLEKYSNNQIALYKKVFDFNATNVDMLVTNITSELIELYYAHQDSMLIIMKDKHLSLELRQWFSDLLKHISLNDYDDLYYNMMSVSIFEGLSYAFVQKVEHEVLEEVVLSYLLRMIKSI